MAKDTTPRKKAPGAVRPDRRPGARGEYEKARKYIFATQTVCGICGKPVDFGYKYPHPLSPTVDHIIPVSKGGHPTDKDNLQLAHRCCNRQKADKLMDTSQFVTEKKLISNRMLPQHLDWVKYRPAKAST